MSTGAKRSLMVSSALLICAPFAPAPVHAYSYVYAVSLGAPAPAAVTTSGLQKGNTVSVRTGLPLYVALMVEPSALALSLTEKRTV